MIDSGDRRRATFDSILPTLNSLRDVDQESDIYLCAITSQPYLVGWTNELRPVGPDERSVRRGQLITTFGAGAIVPLEDESYMVAGIDRWDVMSPISTNPASNESLLPGFVALRPGQGPRRSRRQVPRLALVPRLLRLAPDNDLHRPSSGNDAPTASATHPVSFRGGLPTTDTSTISRTPDGSHRGSREWQARHDCGSRRAEGSVVGSRRRTPVPAVRAAPWTVLSTVRAARRHAVPAPPVASEPRRRVRRELGQFNEARPTSGSPT